MTKITARLTAVIRMTVLLPLLPISVTIGAGPVKYTLTPGGGGVRSTTSWTASTASSFPKAWPRATDEVQLNIRGLTVGALRGARR